MPSPAIPSVFSYIFGRTHAVDFIDLLSRSRCLLRFAPPSCYLSLPRRSLMLLSPLWPGVSSACDIGSSSYFPYSKAPYMSVLGVTQECVLSWALHNSYRSNVLLFTQSPWCAAPHPSSRPVRPLFADCSCLQVLFICRRRAAAEAAAGLRMKRAAH